MFVGGYSHAGGAARSAALDSASPLADNLDDGDEVGADAAQPAYFRTLSSISHGTLSAAYLAMKSFNGGTAPEAAHTDGAAAAIAEPAGAILSGVGIPGALGAYEEAMDRTDL